MVPPPAIQLKNVVLSHDRHPAVHHLSGTFAPGSLTAITGPNGAGKTTLLRALSGLHQLDEGRIDHPGLRPSDIALLPQASLLDRSFPLSCLDVVALGHWGKIGAFRPVTTALRDAAQEALRKVGMESLAARPIGALSAGQFQRVLFARLLAQDCSVMLLDEPFSALDARTTSDLLGVLRGWHQAGKTVVAVLHDLDLIRREFPDTLLLAREAIAWTATETALSAANRMRARILSEVWDDSAEICHVAA
ncbi:MAG: ABC transporter ATP-binding protein [Acetobacteraceae bacterium]|nr:ABC transporter ATP-binding protein [Acetobacteraceae bacterium]